MTTAILLVRHGETDWNRESRFQGHADPPLNERGREQARVLADGLAGESIASVYTSPLRRAFETAQVIAARLGSDLRVLEGLREIDVGSWTGLTRTDIERRFPEAFARWLTLDGHGWDDGETYEQLTSRVVSAVREIAAANPGRQVVVVTHGGAIRSLIAHAAGVSRPDSRRILERIHNCGVSRIVVEDGEIRSVD